ncbi:oxysterol-binding protein-like protein [Lindgomyces ingoldianus]|uniref:Oxysterol-binding protein-like protein n=1 Tax=Lindgomyces ingoldianus TaxID=673940 RepID=A0ACB6QK05_9PLEO|nr:oxysterol-binding protein-like protein [Lindgomyces ingoldianus]KAF2466647.1 oxysterol-binding protein-like protein [Lindgomyces ingoldianus]
MAESAVSPAVAAMSTSPSVSASTSKEPSRAPTPANAPVEKPPDESSKLKVFLGVLRRFIGVADLAAVRFSLPAQLLEPTPNLEYWHYLDRPETFISIGDSDESLGRMLGTLRFWFSKDLKYVKGKPCKPYNSTLGEFFRCNWQVEDTQPPLKHAPNSAPSSSSASATGEKFVKVSYLTEQTSHHPPVSAFYIDCPEKGIIARGYDQLSAKFTGTSIRVIAGAHNLGIFITLQKRDDEMYQLTHPAAYLGGLLRGSLSVSVADSCYVTCAKTKTKVILQYLEEGWLGRTQNKVEGVIFKYDPDNDTKTKVKDVPDKDVLARIEGCWQDKVYYTLGSQPFNKSSEKILLIDLNPLFPVPKIVPPIDQQLPNESRKFWQNVTAAIVNKQYSQATALKQEIEEKQRQKAAERKEVGRDWQPRFFTGAVTPVGKPDLTSDGEEVLRGLHKDSWALEENKEYGA